MARQSDTDFMQRALRLAARAAGKTSPNPMVGAVLVKNGRVVGEGYHRRAGMPHAEIVALKAAGEQARGATLYVTLEPCAHRGRTGPCADALIAAGVKRVYFATVDPNPLVAGRGARKLRQAGIEVHQGLERKAARALNDSYFTFHLTGRPFVTLKIAQTLDGRVAANGGDARWITGKEARKEGHRLRTMVDAVLTGGGTVRTDNPSLTVRHVKGRNPYRVVLSATLNLPPKSRLLTQNQDGRTVLVSTSRAIGAYAAAQHHQNLTYWAVPGTARTGLDLNAVLEQAVPFGIQSILLETGPSLSTAFLNADLVDKVVLFVAPSFLGDGHNALGDLHIEKVANVLRLQDVAVTPVGRDIMVTGYLRKDFA